MSCFLDCHYFWFAGFDKVAVYTDSQFMINCMTSWLKSWKKNNWKKKDGEPVKNKEDLMDLDKATKGLMVKWVGMNFY